MPYVCGTTRFLIIYGPQILQDLRLGHPDKNFWLKGVFSHDLPPWDEETHLKGSQSPKRANIQGKYLVSQQGEAKLMVGICWIDRTLHFRERRNVMECCERILCVNSNFCVNIHQKCFQQWFGNYRCSFVVWLIRSSWLTLSQGVAIDWIEPC